MEMIKKHIDTVVVLGGILGSMVWANGKFNDIDIRLNTIETVLIMRGIMPSEFVAGCDHDSK